MISERMKNERSNVQCRRRWTYTLDPSIVLHQRWSKNEDTALSSVVEELGIGHWKAVSKQLNNGRSDEQCRQRWVHTLVTK